mgnify:CR=1 FL=1
MKNVVHIGPISSLGGMSSVIRLLSENPPEGWSSEIVDTYSNSGIIAKINVIRSAKKKLMDLAKIGDVDIAHIHVTHSFSWWRKRGIMRLCDKLGIRVIVHIHSGKFDIDAKSDLKEYQVVCLSQSWSEKLKPLIGESISVPNPVEPQLSEGIERKDFTLLMGRNDPVKGHEFAYSLGLSDLRVTGVENSPDGVTALGWVSEEEKWRLLQIK